MLARRRCLRAEELRVKGEEEGFVGGMISKTDMLMLDDRLESEPLVKCEIGVYVFDTCNA